VDAGTVLILVAVVAVPLAAISFAMGAGNALREIGKGRFAIDQELPQKQAGTGAPAPLPKEVREAEIRQMLEARSYRRQQKGGEAIDVDAELEKVLAADQPQSDLSQDAELRAEVRQLVVARNERRLRRGHKALDVDTEVERQIRELENLGQ
jgi:hypothetical protein